MTSALLVTGGGSAILWGITTISSAALPIPYRCDGECEAATAAFVGGLVAAPLGAIVPAIAIGLNIDALSRRGALERSRVSIGPGPGELGLSLALAFDLDG